LIVYKGNALLFYRIEKLIKWDKFIPAIFVFGKGGYL